MRRQQGGGPEAERRVIEPRNKTKKGKVDGLRTPEDNIWPDEKARKAKFPRGLRAGHVGQ
jgi:hypothetical protein